MRDLHPVEAWIRWPFDHLRILRAELAQPPAVEPIPPITDGASPAAEAHAQVLRLERVIEMAVEYSVQEIGNGELPGKNNRGPDIARYCEPYGDGWEWCAAFAGYNLARAFIAENLQMPLKKSLSAKKLANHIQAYGCAFKDPALARRGDYLVLDRGVTGSHLGHIEIIEHPLTGTHMFGTIPGNSNPKVVRRRRDIMSTKLRFNRIVSLRPYPGAKP